MRDDTVEATDRRGSIQAVIRATKAGRESLQSQKLRRILTDEEEFRFGRTEIGEAVLGGRCSRRESTDSAV